MLFHEMIVPRIRDQLSPAISMDQASAFRQIKYIKKFPNRTHLPALIINSFLSAEFAAECKQRNH